MGQIAGFVSKSELERVRLIREARAIYDSIFPPTDAAGERPDGRLCQGAQPGGQEPAPAKRNGRVTRPS
ncbi:MAG: hypothetical protein ACLQDM_02320 [Bradyrhizobium sp.]